MQIRTEESYLHSVVGMDCLVTCQTENKQKKMSANILPETGIVIHTSVLTLSRPLERSKGQGHSPT